MTCNKPHGTLDRPLTMVYHNGMSSTDRHPAHQANIDAKANRALVAIHQLVDAMIANGLAADAVTDRLTGLRYFRHALVALNDPHAWAAICALTGDTDYRTSRQRLFELLSARIDMLADQAVATAEAGAADPFAGLVS